MQPIFKAEKRFTIVERVIDQIRKAINSGKLKPGDRLVEKDIADSMQIGRSAVREDFRYLVSGRKLTHLLRCCKILKSSCTDVHSGFRISCALHMGNFSSTHGVFGQALFRKKRLCNLMRR